MEDLFNNKGAMEKLVNKLGLLNCSLSIARLHEIQKKKISKNNKSHDFTIEYISKIEDKIINIQKDVFSSPKSFNIQKNKIIKTANTITSSIKALSYKYLYSTELNPVIILKDTNPLEKINYHITSEDITYLENQIIKLITNHEHKLIESLCDSLTSRQLYFTRNICEECILMMIYDFTVDPIILTFMEKLRDYLGVLANWLITQEE